MKEEDVFINAVTYNSSTKWKTGEVMPEILNNKTYYT